MKTLSEYKEYLKQKGFEIIRIDTDGFKYWKPYRTKYTLKAIKSGGGCYPWISVVPSKDGFSFFVVINSIDNTDIQFDDIDSCIAYCELIEHETCD